MITAERLALTLLEVTDKIHPEYTHEQHLAWTIGFLARYVLRKNHMDSQVYAELNHELNQLLGRREFQEFGFEAGEEPKRQRRA